MTPEQRRDEALGLLEDLEAISLPTGNDYQRRSVEFVEDMCERRDKYNEDFLVSEAQLQWLRQLHDEHC